MRMAVDQFLAKAVAHVFDVERRFFFTDLGIEDNVQEQVAQFFFDVIVVKAHRIQDKARNVGFDWEQRDQVWDKVHEEFTELKTEIDKMDADKMEAEFGDLFFSLINAARLYKINPDNALERTNQKFTRRFNYLEEHTIKEGKSLKDMSLEEMDRIWNEAKAKGL